MLFMKIVILLLLLFQHHIVLFVIGWHVCPLLTTTTSSKQQQHLHHEQQRQHICPDGNRCCFDPIRHQYMCITGINITDGICCHDDNNDDHSMIEEEWNSIVTSSSTTTTKSITTGCGKGYVCATRGDNNNMMNYDTYCQKVKSKNNILDDNTDDRPDSDSDIIISSSNTTSSSTTTTMYQHNNVEENESLPEQLPRYQLCSVQKDPTILQNVYGFPITMNDIISSSSSFNDRHHDHHRDHQLLEQLSPAVAYLSNIGSMDNNYHYSKNVEKIIIMIHGSLNNVEDYMCCIHSILERYSNNDNQTTNTASNNVTSTKTTMIITPWFLSSTDNFPGFHNVIDNDQVNQKTTFQPLRWYDQVKHGMDHSWLYGADAVILDDNNSNDNNKPIRTNISSYDVMDCLIQYLFQHRHDLYPSLKHIVLAGHSAGGQYVQKYTLLSNHILFPSYNNDTSTATMSATFTDDTFDAQNNFSLIKNTAMTNRHRMTTKKKNSSEQERKINIRSVVANPKSYCYFDNRRYINHQYRSLTKSEIKFCPEYNMWPWGFDDNTITMMTTTISTNSIKKDTNAINDIDDMIYHRNRYKNDAIKKVNGQIDHIIQRYRIRDVIYVQGQLDIEWNGICSAQIQGRNRLKRNQIYYDYLQWYYQNHNDSSAKDEYIDDNSSNNETSHMVNSMYQKNLLRRNKFINFDRDNEKHNKIHQQVIVPKVHHDHCLMFQSLLGQKTMFG